MRGDDQPSRYPPRGVWFGLILAACALRIATAQDATGPARRGPAEPLVLSGGRVSTWGRSGWAVRLPVRAASVFQGTEGLRRAGRLPDRQRRQRRRSPLRGRGLRRGQRPPHLAGAMARRSGTAPASARSEVQLQAYESDGVESLRSPPWSLPILRRSGFLGPDPPASKPAPHVATGAPSRRRPPAGIPGRGDRSGGPPAARAARPSGPDPAASVGRGVAAEVRSDGRHGAVEPRRPARAGRR